MKHRIAVALSILAIAVATLHPAGDSLPRGWSFTLTTGEAALAELIQNLLLFIPLGASLALAGRRPLAATLIGAAVSFAVEFAQQWIPGRDPSVGDIVLNTVSTTLGVAIMRYGPRVALLPSAPSAAASLAAAVLAVLVWLATGALLQPALPPLPYIELRAPQFNYWGHYEGKISGISSIQGTLIVQATAPDRPPGRPAPIVALVDTNGIPAIILAVDTRDLALRYHMLATEFRLEQVDLRWRGAFDSVAPNEDFLAGTRHDSTDTCLGLNGVQKCSLGYTIGDGWKLIFYPDQFPGWVLVVLNSLWVAGWMIGVGWWAARTAAAKEAAARKTAATMARIAVGIVLLGLVIVPWVTGLKGTTLWEWIGALGGIELGLVLGSRSVQSPPLRRPSPPLHAPPL